MREKVLDSFSQVLRQALLDTQIERERGGVRFYFDTDVVLPIILGVDNVDFSSSERKVELVRSLASAAFFGRIHMLRPHAFELNHQLRLKTEAADERQFRDAVKNLFSKYRVADKAKELREVIDASRQDPEKQLDRFTQIFSGYSSDMFIAIERATGHWTKRLKRLYEKVLSFKRMGPEIADLWGERGENFRFFHEIIQHHRPAYPRPNMMDAAALASLQNLVHASDEEGGPVVRFYTETSVLWRAWQETPALRERLSHAPPEGHADAYPGDVLGVFRNAEYLLMRLRFPELTPVSKDPQPLNQLETLLASVADASRLTDDRFKEALKSIKYKGKPLGQMLEEFEAFSLMGTIWHKGLDRNLLSQNLEDFKTVYDFMEDRRVDLTHKIDDIRDELSGQLSGIAQWSQDFKAVHSAGERLRKRIAGQQLRPVQDPERDLGMVRWGLEMSGKRWDELAQTLDELGSKAVGNEFDTQCYSLATRMAKARKDVAECTWMAALLWALEEYNQAARLINDFCRGEPKSLPRGLNLLRVAAHIRAGSGLSAQDRDKAIEELRGMQKSLGGAERGIYNLGLGYVLYCAWNQETRGIASHSSPAQDLALECFKLGEEAVELLARHDQGGNRLALAFALNHCAYIATMTKPFPREDVAKKYVDQLMSFKTYEIWNARFEDTIGMYKLGMVERRLKRKPFVDPDGALRDLKAAQEYLSEAKATNTGGIDIEAHHVYLHAMEDKLNKKLKRTQARRAGERPLAKKASKGARFH